MKRLQRYAIGLSTIPSPNALENLYQVYLMHLHTAIYIKHLRER